MLVKMWSFIFGGEMYCQGINIVVFRKKYRSPLEGDMELKVGVGMATLPICNVYSEKQVC